MSLSSCPSAFSYCTCFVCKKDNWMRKLEGIFCLCLDVNCLVWHGLVFQCLGMLLISKDIKLWESWECCQLKNHISITINNAITFWSFYNKYGLCAHWPQKKHGISGGTGTILLCSQSHQRNPGLHQLTTLQGDKSLTGKSGKLWLKRKLWGAVRSAPLALLARQPTGQWTP